MFKVASVATAMTIAVTANPFVGENMDKLHVEHGDGRWSTKLKPGKQKMHQFKHSTHTKKAKKTMF